jgi:sortase B
LVFGSYAIWDSRQVHNEALAVQYEKYKPSAENQLSFQELQAINPEVFSWLTVYGTHIDYPVAQGDNDNNIKYVNTNALGRYSISGSIFLDYKNKKDYSDFKNILYGHHMDKNAMFGEIGNFADKNYFNARKYGMLYYGGREYGLVFFAFAHTDAYNDMVFNVDVKEKSQKQLHLDNLLRLSIHICKDVSVTADDRIVLLSTCSSGSTNGRDILIGKITDEIYEDIFKTENTDKTNPVIDELSSLWHRASTGIKIAIISLPFLLILLAVILIYKKRSRSRKERITIPGNEGNRKA